MHTSILRPQGTSASNAIRAEGELGEGRKEGREIHIKAANVSQAVSRLTLSPTRAFICRAPPRVHFIYCTHSDGSGKDEQLALKVFLATSKTQYFIIRGT